MSLNGSVDESIFYKKNKTSEEAKKFWEMFFRKFHARVEELEEVDVNGQKVKRLVFEKDITAGGFVFPKLFENDKVVLEYSDPKTGLTWVGKFPFKHALFKKKASFNGAIFEGIMSFYKATFEEEATFDNATFKGYVSFDRAVFKGTARFNDAKFENAEDLFPPTANREDQMKRFWKEVSPELRVGHEHPQKKKLRDGSYYTNDFYEFSATFIRASFQNRVSFKNATFYGATRFSFSKFEEESPGDSFYVEFEKTKFLGPSTEFIKCTFHYESRFDNTEFRGYVNFKGSVFEKFAEFSNANFLVDVETRSAGRFGFSPIDFRGVRFKGDASFRGAQFYSKPNFSEAHFEGSVAFTRTIEMGARYCTFHRGADFVECVFEKEADFQWCIFREPSIPVINPNYEYPQTSFARSTFKDVAAFDFAEFGKAIFNFAVFEKGARFNYTIFYDEAQFEETKFREPVEFHSTRFIENVRFKSTFFDSIAEFPEAIFLQSADFSGAIFNNRADFKRAFFNGDAIFRDASFRLSVDFSEKPTEEELRKVLSDVRLKDVLLSKKIQINFGYKFGGKVDFSHTSVTAMKFVELDKLIPESSDYEMLLQEFAGLFRVPEAIIESARIQRVSFDKEGKREEADRMFVLEMRARRRVRSERANMKIRNFLEWLIGDLPSEYGTNWRRIIWVSLLVVLYFGIAYWLEILSYSFYTEWDIEWFKWLDLGMFWTLFGVSYLVVLYYRGIFENITTLEEFISGIRRYWKYWVIVLGPTYLAWIGLSNFSLPFNARVLNKATIQLSNNVIIALNPENPGSCFGTLLNSLYYSLVTFTTLGYGDMHPTGWLKALSAAEALTGAVFMALIVAVIARKWMR
ncbi:pentapeptide repeat-containing protein [Thermococcus sp. GR6]|uniref:pentapeptide repeat-containing protein n=1 Tax=Thermococcus sp. GR6 TaxID=1638256 RepID=UPI00142F6DFF|nr:pentapeptide repeat-containing protein [Thermococcus sp. GR6]NJE43449.1 hypothetical protein [Thermococcus sp. GR6]